MIETISFESVQKWPHLVILGSIHGDEKCGTVAIDEAVSYFQSGKWVLQKWKITFIPRANRCAYDADVRQIEYNLNRIFGAKNRISYEHKIAELLESHLANADYVIDLHSVYSGDTPFVFLDSKDVTTKALCRHLSLPYIMTGWDEIYAQNEEKDTISYAISKGVQGITIECGSHKTNESIEIAKKSVREVLEFFELIDGKKMPAHMPQFIKVEKLFFRPENAIFAKDWKNFDVLKKGDVIGVINGENILAEEDGFIILPKSYGKVGDEWYYLGKSIV